MAINFKAYKESGKGNTIAKRLPEDVYEVTVTEASLTTSSKGSMMIKITLQINEGPFANTLLWDQFVISDKALGFLYSFLEAVGSPLIEEDVLEEKEVVKDIIGRRCRARVKPEPNNSTQGFSNKVNKYAKTEKKSTVVNTPTPPSTGAKFSGNSLFN